MDNELVGLTPGATGTVQHLDARYVLEGGSDRNLSVPKCRLPSSKARPPKRHRAFPLASDRQLVRVKGESWGEPQSWGSPERRNGWRRQRPRTNGYRVSAAPMGRLIEGAPAFAVLGMAGCAHRKAGE